MRDAEIAHKSDPPLGWRRDGSCGGVATTQRWHRIACVAAPSLGAIALATNVSVFPAGSTSTAGQKI